MTKTPHILVHDAVQLGTLALTLLLELALGYTGLADDGLKCAYAQLGMAWNRDGERGIGESFLHDDVAAALAHFEESVTGENAADLFSGEDAELTQRRSLTGLRILHRAHVTEFLPERQFQKIVRAPPGDFPVPLRWCRLGWQYQAPGRGTHNRSLHAR